MREKVNDLRKFNGEGEQEYKRLVRLGSSDLADELKALCVSDTHTVRPPQLQFEWEIPITRLEVGSSLYKYLGPTGPLRAFSADSALWNWVSAIYLSRQGNADQLAKNLDSWIFNSASNRYYRHAFFSSFFLYESHIDNVSEIEGLLYRRLSEPRGEFLEQVLATPDIAHSSGARLASRLYFDPATRALKPGASSKGAGSSRRLTSAFLNQIRLNIDFKGMSVDALFKLLPAEFDRFKDPLSQWDGHPATPSDSQDGVDFDDLRDQVNFL